jgi:hypothetical protein
MIRIDEIYQNVFFPYFASKHKNLELAVHDPFGSSDPDSIVVYINGSHQPGDYEDPKKFKYLYMFDQEPIHKDILQPAIDKIKEFSMSKKFAMVTSERDSENVHWLYEQLGGEQFYYFFHGWAALDWYRGFDRSFIVEPPADRTIKKTFISPNRIIGGKRRHRVAMLYHMLKNDLWHNHISAPRVCPVEGEDILDIAGSLTKYYPDIVHVLKDANLPRTFNNETTQEMSSYSLTQRDECCESLFYHVTETVATGKRHHITEKTFKPIVLQMPFILTAPAYSLAYLKQYGFMTFGSIWDESYDFIEDDFERYTAVGKLMKQLDNYTPAEKHKLWLDCLPIVKYNYEHFYKGSFERLLWQELTVMMEQINDYFSN